MHAAIVLALGALGANYVTPLTDAQRAQAQAAVASFQADKLGPYGGISWYCEDGTEQLPRLNGCADHGGGHMYGVLSPAAERLGKLGIYVGTVLTALPTDALAEDGLYRARALVIERYLERALDGWVMRKAKNVRGLRQDEDEADAARDLLIDLAGRRDVLDHDRVVVIRLTRALPYGRGEEALADQIRGLAAKIGDADPAFADLRFKIHALPDVSDIAAVDGYARTASGSFAEDARALADLMRRYYDPATRFQRLRDVKGWLALKAVRDAIDAFVATDPRDPMALLDRGAALVEAAGSSMWAATDARMAERNLLRLHTIGIVEELWLGLGAELARRPMSRAAAMDAFRKLSRSAELAGLLSARERAAAESTLASMHGADAPTYARLARGLGRVLEWARARVGYEIGLPLARYEAVEPKSALAVDDILRSGVMLPLATLYDRLVADGDRLGGGGHRLAGIDAPAAGLRGENGGLAAGPLRVVGGEAEGKLGALERGAVALLRDLPPDLPPVSGIVTVGAPGSLSHVALLARNLGIPLAAVSGDVATALESHAGEPVVLGVSAGRRVLLGLRSALGDADRALLALDDRSPSDAARAGAPAAGSMLTIDAARLDLATTRVLRLEEVSENDAGVRCGPKAAELGRLRRLFPERVADAAVIPFGAFVRHVDGPVEATRAAGGRNGTGADGTQAAGARAGTNGTGAIARASNGTTGAAVAGPTPLAELRAAYTRYAGARATGTDGGPADEAMLAALARFRDAILTRPFPPGFEAEVRAALARLGTPGTFGVFVRSDTNVEDLKDFTGAGLNLTVPNRVAVRDVLEAIREVWASPYSERSFRWRQRLLTNPEAVFPSVVLHRTVPSEISGVIVTTDLETLDGSAATVSAGEGVSAVVDGGSPETVVLEAGGGVRLLASARSPTRKVIPPPPAQGSVLAAATGRDPLLGERELAELRRLVAEVRARIPPKAEGLPWDVEFGIVRGKAFLMQIRPLKLSRAAAAHPLLVALDAAAPAATGAVALDEALP